MYLDRVHKRRNMKRTHSACDNERQYRSNKYSRAGKEHRAGVNSWTSRQPQISHTAPVPDYQTQTSMHGYGRPVYQRTPDSETSRPKFLLQPPTGFGAPRASESNTPSQLRQRQSFDPYRNDEHTSPRESTLRKDNPPSGITHRKLPPKVRNRDKPARPPAGERHVSGKERRRRGNPEYQNVRVQTKTGSSDFIDQQLETNPRVIAQRQKQIMFGKDSPGYVNYLQLVPKNRRDRSDPEKHPRTPNPRKKMSKRAFDGIVRAWRRHLHQFDEPSRAGIDGNETTTSSEPSPRLKTQTVELPTSSHHASEGELVSASKEEDVAVNKKTVVLGERGNAEPSFEMDDLL